MLSSRKASDLEEAENRRHCAQWIAADCERYDILWDEGSAWGGMRDILHPGAPGAARIHPVDAWDKVMTPRLLHPEPAHASMPQAGQHHWVSIHLGGNPSG